MLSTSVRVELIVAKFSPSFPFGLFQGLFFLGNFRVNTGNDECFFLTVKGKIFGGAHVEFVQTVVSIIRVSVPAVNQFFASSTSSPRSASKPESS